MQTQKWVNLGLLVASVLIFLFCSQLFEALWGLARLPINEDWPLEPHWVVSFLVAAGLFLWVRRYQKANVFFNEVATELSKVSWPPSKETVLSARVVIVILAIATAALFVIDQLWRVAIRGALSQ